MKSIRKFSIAAALLVVAGLAACESQDKTDGASMGVMNDTCPMMGGPVDPGAPTAHYKGGEVGFCCAGCVSKWNALTDDQKSQKMAAVK